MNGPIPDAVAHDALIAHKSPYLNVPFFYFRMILFFALWILMIWLIRKTSLQEDREGGLQNCSIKVNIIPRSLFSFWL